MNAMTIAHMAGILTSAIQAADLIGRRCIALTGMDVTLDGPLDLIRLSPVHAVLKYRGIGLHVIDCDLRHHTNKTSDGIRAVVITESKP